MATNFSVADSGVQSYVTDGGVHVSRYRRMQSAVYQAVLQSGGKVYPNLAPVDTSIPVFSGQTAVVGTAESQVGGSNSKQSSSRAATHMSLLVKAHGEVERTTNQAIMAQLHGAGTNAALGAQLVLDKLPAIYGGFDRDHLRAIATQASATDVEWNAADPIASISSAFAVYDNTAYNGDAMIVTRAGARKMGLATDGNGRLQFTGPLESAFPVDIPVIYTDATATDINKANLLAVIGPWSACAVGEAGSTIIKMFDQLEADGGGAQENIISFLVERYMGFAQVPTTVVPQTGWVTITDDA